MTAKPKARSKCKHPRLSRESVCYDCGAFVDLTEKKNKHGNIPAFVDGLRFGSGLEARRYEVLKLMQKAGEISGLIADKKQLRWKLEVNGILICTYEADFWYVADKGKVIEDAKGFKTPAYKLKKKLMKACHGIEVQEI
jgi:hypothetical protein